MDSPVTSLDSSIMTEGDIELDIFEVLDESIRYKTRNGNEIMINNLNQLPPYKIAKGEVDVTCPETRKLAWDEIGVIFDKLVEQNFKAAGSRNCWNYTSLCTPTRGCRVGDGVLAFNSSSTIKGHCLGPDNDYPMCRTIASLSNGTNMFTLNPRERYVIHGNIGDGYDVDLINLSRKEIFYKFGLRYCPSHLLGGEPITVSVGSGRYLGQFALVPSGGPAQGDFSVRIDDGRRRTTYFTQDVPKLRVRIRNSRDLLLSTKKKASPINVIKRAGRVVAVSDLGEEVSGAVLLCHMSSIDIQVQFCHCALFQSPNGLCYSSGVLFESADELRKYFFPVGQGLYFNSYTGELGKLEARGRHVHFNVDSTSDENFICPRGKFRVAG